MKISYREEGLDSGPATGDQLYREHDKREHEQYVDESTE
jgi:hypothetical protein